MQKIKEATLSSKGQVTIPKLIRDILKVNIGESVAFYIAGNEVVLTSSANLDVKLKNEDNKTIIKKEKRKWVVLKKKLKSILRKF